MADDFDTNSPSYFLGRLVKASEEQSKNLETMAKKVDTLTHVPNKLDKMSDEIHDLKKTQLTVTRHSVVITLIGACVVIGAPIMATWNYHLRSELNELHKTTAQLEERLRREEAYNRPFEP